MTDERSPLLSRLPPGSEPTVEGSGNHEDPESARSTDTTEASTQPLIFIVVPMALGVFLAALDGTIVVSSYAAIGSELQQLQNTSWIATGYMLTLTSFQPLYGKLSDIFGRKACLLFAYAVFAAGCLLCGMAQNMSQLIAARSLAGIGGGGMTTVVSIVMSDIVPLQSRGTWQGLLNIVFATGSAIGAPLGGFLADTIGWRWAFLIQVPIAVIAIMAVSLALHLPKKDVSDFKNSIKRVDFAGAVTLVSAVFFLLLGLDRGGNISWKDNVSIGSLVAFSVLFLLFAVVEMELAKEPFAPKRIIYNRSLIASYLVNFFTMAAFMNLLFHLSLYFQAVQHRSASSAGLGLLPSVLGGVVGSLGGGLIMQRTGKYYKLTIFSCISALTGVIIVTLAAGVLGQVPVAVSVGLLIGAVGNGSVITTTLIALIANAGPEDQAIATAVSYLFRSLGSVLGLSVGSTLVQDTLRRQLQATLDGADVAKIVRGVRESLGYIEQLEPSVQILVRSAYGNAVQATMWLSVGLLACSLLSAVFIKETSLAPRH